jgi:hypothetical protein
MSVPQCWISAVNTGEMLEDGSWAGCRKFAREFSRGIVEIFA